MIKHLIYGMSATEIEKINGISRTTTLNRIKRGWGHQDIIFQPRSRTANLKPRKKRVRIVEPLACDNLYELGVKLTPQARLFCGLNIKEL